MAPPCRSIEEAQKLATGMLRDYITARIDSGSDRRIKRSDLRQVLHYRGLAAFLDLALTSLVKERVIEWAPEGHSVYVMPQAIEGEGGES